MTLAICVACGSEKFGAWVPCPKCGFNPQTKIDKAKSFMLSDHHYASDELYGFGERIASGQPVRYDPVHRAYCSQAISEHEYFWAHVDRQGTLQCRRCGATFTPEEEEALCPRCILETEQALWACPNCTKVFQGDAKYCQSCGAILTSKPGLSPSGLGSQLAIACRRVLTAKDPLNKSTFLAEARSRLSGFVHRKWS